jgi:hypothetical protein
MPRFLVGWLLIIHAIAHAFFIAWRSFSHSGQSRCGGEAHHMSALRRCRVIPCIRSTPVIGSITR